MAAEERAVQVPIDGGAVDGDLALPTVVRGVVLFAHGSGSSRSSSRNRYVAAGLREAGFATLLMDLLTPQEESVDLHTREHRFDIPLLSQRLTAAVDALETMPSTEDLTSRLRRSPQGPCEMAVVPGATHLFEEPGALDQVIALTTEWLHCHVPDRP